MPLGFRWVRISYGASWCRVFFSDVWPKCGQSFFDRSCIPSTETARAVREDGGAQDGHLHFHTAPELWGSFVLCAIFICLQIAFSDFVSGKRKETRGKNIFKKSAALTGRSIISSFLSSFPGTAVRDFVGVPVSRTGTWRNWDQRRNLNLPWSLNAEEGDWQLDVGRIMAAATALSTSFYLITEAWVWSSLSDSISIHWRRFYAKHSVVRTWCARWASLIQSHWLDQYIYIYLTDVGFTQSIVLYVRHWCGGWASLTSYNIDTRELCGCGYQVGTSEDFFFFKCCFTYTCRDHVRDGEPRTAVSTFTQLLSFDPDDCSPYDWYTLVPCHLGWLEPETRTRYTGCSFTNSQCHSKSGTSSLPTGHVHSPQMPAQRIGVREYWGPVCLQYIT